ncbi:MAG: SDR family NAD(P)-dependent oxidoreductase [Fimbriimonadaceae bacterium]|nr:SDR family NAD(P)-dependent oxidoreductase [Fimbriimonadaceae bacterium]
MPERFAHVLIIGASSGIGYELARQYAEAGSRVAAVARREDRLQALRDQYPDRVIAVVADVKDLAFPKTHLADITQLLGGLDLAVYCAGVMPEVGPTEFNSEKDAEMIAVNFAGGVAWLNAVAERFQALGSGAIVGIGSVAGDRGRRGQPVYNASKAAFATYLEALRNRLSSKGVAVATIKPGPVATEMTARLNLSRAMPVDVAAQRIRQRCGQTGEFYLSPVHRVLFGILRAIPSFIFRRLPLP